MMAPTNEEDPFLQVQQDVLSQMQTARPLFASYLRIRSLTTTTTTGPSSSSGPELASARADLEACLGALAEDLADLVESVRAVESAPSRFGLSAPEVARRRRLVRDVGGEVEDMRDALLSQTQSQSQSHSQRPQRQTQQQQSNNRRVEAARAAADGELPDPNAFALDEDLTRSPTNANNPDANPEDDDEYAEFEHRQQLAVMREQDEQLDGVFATVGSLRRQADDMGRELEEQRDLLDHVDGLADRVGGRLQTGAAKLAAVARRSEDRWSGCCVGVLIVVLIVLLLLLLLL